MTKSKKTWFFNEDNRITFIRNKAEQLKAPHWAFDPKFAFISLLAISAADCAIFYSLFSNHTNGASLLLVLELAVFLMAFDLIPFLVGLQLKKMEYEGKTNKLIVNGCLIAPVVAFILNVVVRFMVMGGTQGSTEQERLAGVLLSCFLPVITIVVGFATSYIGYDHKTELVKRYLCLIAEKEEQLREIDTILHEYEASKDQHEFNLKQDKDLYEQAKAMHRSLAIHYATVVRNQLMQKMGEPASVSALSAEISQVIVEGYEKQLQQAGIPVADNKTV